MASLFISTNVILLGFILFITSIFLPTPAIVSNISVLFKHNANEQFFRPRSGLYKIRSSRSLHILFAFSLPATAMTGFFLLSDNIALAVSFEILESTGRDQTGPYSASLLSSSTGFPFLVIAYYCFIY